MGMCCTANMATELDVLRLLLRFSSYHGTLPQVWPEAMPRHAPCPLPGALPALLGSIERVAGEAGWYSAQLFFQPVADVQGQDALMLEVTRQLYECGWTRQVFPMMRPSGLLSQVEVPALTAQPVPDDLPEPPTNLVHHDSKCAATWNTTFSQEQLFVQLEVQNGPAYDHWHHQTDVQTLSLPALTPPAGWVTETLSGGGSGNMRASVMHSSLLLGGSGTLDELSAHYAGQLQQQGWTEQQHTITPELALSTWQTPQGDQGQLTVVQRAAGQWQASLYVTHLHEFRADGNLGSSWYSF